MFNLARHPFLEAEILKKKNAIVKYLKNLNLPTWPNSQKGKTQNHNRTLYCHIPCCCGALARALRMRNVMVCGSLSSMVPSQASLQLLVSLDFSRIVQYSPITSSSTYYVNVTKCHSDTKHKENPYPQYYIKFFGLRKHHMTSCDAYTNRLESHYPAVLDMHVFVGTKDGSQHQAYCACASCFLFMLALSVKRRLKLG